MSLPISLGSFSKKPAATSISKLTRGPAATSINSVNKKPALTSITHASGDTRTSTSIHRALQEKSSAPTSSITHVQSQNNSQHDDNQVALDKRYNENRDRRIAAYRAKLRSNKDNK